MKLEPPYFESFTWEDCYKDNNNVKPVFKYWINNSGNSYYCQECFGVIKLTEENEELPRVCPFCGSFPMKED